MSRERKTASAGAVVELALHRSTARVQARLLGACAGGVEDVHQARVGIRRLRSHLRTFATLLDEDWAADLRTHLGAVGDALGEVRDIDVFELTLQRLASERPELGIELGCIRDLAARQRLDAHRSLERALADPSLAAWLQPSPGADEQVPLRGRADRPGRKSLPKLVRRRWRVLEQAVLELGDRPSDRELHRLRIEVKRCRYAVDAVRPVVGRGARRLSKRLARLQDVLGDLNDAVVIADRLRAGARAEPAIALSAGQLTVLLSEQAERCRGEWRAAWEAAAAPRLRRWLR